MNAFSYDLNSNRGRKFNQPRNPMSLDFIKGLNFMNNNLSEVFKGFGDAFRSTECNCELDVKLDIYEDDINYEIIVELPGVGKEGVKIIATNDEQIEIKVNKASSVDAENNSDKRVLIQERSFGNFTRSITFGKKINKNTISAKWNNGELIIVVPKAVSEEPKEVEIAIS